LPQPLIAKPGVILIITHSQSTHPNVKVLPLVKKKLNSLKHHSKKTAKEQSIANLPSNNPIFQPNVPFSKLQQKTGSTSLSQLATLVRFSCLHKR
jgi:hypothetical protein